MKANASRVATVLLAIGIVASISLVGAVAADPEVGVSGSCEQEADGGDAKYKIGTNSQDSPNQERLQDTVLLAAWFAQNNFDDCNSEEPGAQGYGEAHVDTGQGSAQWCQHGGNRQDAQDQINSPSEHEESSGSPRCTYGH